MSGTGKFRAACVQLCTGRSVPDNIEAAAELIRAAANDGADYVLTPEQTALMELERDALFAGITEEEKDPTLARMQPLAKELGVFVHIGSVAVKVGPDKAANRSFLIGPDGTVRARYDKIHMFDVDLPGGENYRESRTYRPGGKAVLADLPWGRLGFSICYDLRFAYLYRRLAQGGAAFLTTPAAFTKQTGEAHWHVLQRARAIETGCFVFAAAQGGHHENGRDTFGHSMIVDPWGRIVAEAGTDPCFIIAEVDPALVIEARTRVPALSHDREIALAVAEQGS